MRKPQYMKYPVQFLESMKELKNRYNGAIDAGVTKQIFEAEHGMRCLLCNPIGIETTRADIEWQIRKDTEPYRDKFNRSCAILGCPWIVITGMTCCDYSERKVTGCNHNKHVYNTNDVSIMKQRVRQIDRWIKIYEKYIDENKITK